MGMGNGGNFLWSLLWFILLLVIAFPLAGFCAGFYIIFVPFTVCIEGLKGFTDFLLKGLNLTYLAADHMMKGTPVGDAFKYTKRPPR
ncbi:hypothetical protein TCAL_05991 [Tigriopus californicus]|uniref:Uncharacterized protein n=1 Tax=Tigriopus californicus TaxID=6832 RepID=A0A553PQV2_TIGCA|nr:hypothetical protein TCAL_05991 [Tigriopus californicus]|eukprot:TCALIF_05991-PA protein Name:"Protein of unknown function" AED:0.01 eAED:0.01 QI:94/1/1/1/1/1/2/90/86